MVRQILLGSCFLIVAWFAFVNPPAWLAGSKQSGQVLAQVSPLASPLTVTGVTTTSVTTTSTTTPPENPPTAAIPSATAPVNRSPISVVLVALVFLGILSVIGLILWRRR